MEGLRRKEPTVPPGRAASGERRLDGIPTRPSPLFGRQRDLDTAQALLLRGEVRFVTITGPPGVGKTRFAVELATLLKAEFDDGTVFVELAPISDPSLVLNAIGQALGVLEDPGRPLVRTLCEYLRNRSMLLVLDNFEHVLGAAADVASLLTVGRDLKLLVTSREPLHVSWEQTYALSPLPVPPATTKSKSPDLAHYPATALFLERAQAGASGYAVDSVSGQVIAAICARVDGLPLGIELAAAWLRILRPEVILSRLEEGGELPERAPHGLPERHRTLTQAIGSSYGLLNEKERAVFRRLGVFAGGCSLDALEAVCADLRIDVLSPTASLVDKNLLLRLDEGGPRFHMLETIRSFASDALDQAGEANEGRGRHAAWCLEFATRARRLLWSEHQETWLKRVDGEHDNIRLALRWSLGGGAEETGARLAAAMHRYWYVRGHFREAQRWLEVAATRPGVSDRARAEALTGLAFHLYARGQADSALAAAEKAVALARVIDDPGVTAFAIQSAALAASAKADPRTEEWTREMLAAARRAGDDWLTARALAYLSGSLKERGDATGAQRSIEEALLLARRLRDKWLLSTVLGNFGGIIASDDPARAEGFVRESLGFAYETGHRWRIVLCLEHLAALLATSGRPEAAAVLLGSSETQRQAIGSARDVWAQLRFEQTSARARERLGRERFETLSDKGGAMTLEQAVAFGLDRPGMPSEQRQRPGGLTGREVQITGAVARGLTNREVAIELGISERTVDTHVQNILNKLGMGRRTQLATWAAAHLPPPPSN